jgi:hypothetical protein
VNEKKIKTNIVTTAPMFEIKENLEPQVRNYLWGLDLTQKEAYEIITKKDEDYFDFVFKRMFENEYHGVIIKNIGYKNIHKFKKYLPKLNSEAKEKWKELIVMCEELK